MQALPPLSCRSSHLLLLPCAVALVVAVAAGFALLRRRRRHGRRTDEVSQPPEGAGASGAGDMEQGLQPGSPLKPLDLSRGAEGEGKQLGPLRTASSGTSDGLEDVAALWAGAASAAGLTLGDSAFSSGELERAGSGMAAADAQA